MSRLALHAATALATLTLAVPAFAADYDMGGMPASTDLRTGFNDDWSMSDQDDPLTFELGTRVWYSWGAQKFKPMHNQAEMSESDQTQSGEVYFRINDNSSKFYAKGIGGLSVHTSGSDYLDQDINSGTIGYAGGDIGYSWLGDFKSPLSFGPFLGYMYWKDSPNPATNNLSGVLSNFTTATSAADLTVDPTTGRITFPEDSRENDIESNLIRVGVSGQARIGSLVDISGEVAAVPYALMKGTLGSGAFPTFYAPIGNNVTNVKEINSSPTELNGWGYGAMAEAMLGIHPTDNITLRLGGRAWYLQGTADTTYSRAEIGNTADTDNNGTFDQQPTYSSQGYVERAQPWSLFRYGALAEFTYNF